MHFLICTLRKNINEVIPLNFLLHYSDRQLLNDYHKATGLDHLAHNNSKQLPNTRTRYPCKAHTQPLSRYQARNSKPPDKKEQGLPQTTLAVTKNKPPNETNSTHLDQLKDLVSIPTVNKLQLVNRTTDHLSLHQDQLQKQVVNMIREVLKDLKQVIPANNKPLFLENTSLNKKKLTHYSPICAKECYTI